MATEFDKLLDEADIITNEEHSKILLDEKIKLLVHISINEKLDLDMLKKKYLNISEVEKKTEPIQETSLSKDEILDTIIIDNSTYYYQPINNGKVYNNKSQIVGSYCSNKIIFN